MSNADLLKRTIAEVARLIQSREVSPVEITEAALAQAERLQPVLNSFITLLPDQALTQARAREEAIGKGDYRGPLDGIPIGIKDNLSTAGIRTTLGTKVLSDQVPDSDAAVVERCREAGAIMLGKENMHEFAAGGTSDNPHYGAVHNPWGLGHVPGGSSGGGGANVAACVTFASLGTDLAGSVRSPAAYCGIVGLKPTFGRVSSRGLLGTSFNGDHIGPLTRSAEDSALVLQAIAGHDPLDPSSVPVPVPDYSAELDRGLTGIKVGVPSNYFFDAVDSENEASVRRAIAALEELGAVVTEVRLDMLRYADAIRIIGMADNFIVHEAYLAEHRADYSPDLVDRYLAGQFILGRDYAKAMKVQRLIKEEFARVLQQVDVLATPTTVMPPPLIGASTVRISGVEHRLTGPLRNAMVRNAHVANATGHPAVSVPCGFTETGLPIGLQLTGRPFEEALLLRVARGYQEVSPAKGKLPGLVA
jgi:aspartyl-tRNA(Asn)/glutamyl-tRNA(Gln) amidotransferase subunit A